MSKSDKNYKKLLKQKFKLNQEAEFLNSLPASTLVLQGLFDWLDSQLSFAACDNTLKFSLKFLESNQLPKTKLIEWLESNGGYCDCEVLANVEEKINDC